MESKHNHLPTKASSSRTLYWKNLREQALNCNEEDNSNSASCEEDLCVSTHFEAFGELITKYVSVLTCIDTNYEQGGGGGGVESTLLHEKSDEEKSLILETRYALRYMLTLLCKESCRRHIQEEAVCIHKLHRKVSSLLSTEYSDYCDKKCQLMAAKIMCNLGTCNQTTSLILLKEIKPSPNSFDGDADSERSSEGHATKYFSSIPSWGEMIHTTASMGERETLAAIVASIHNFILAVNNINIELNANEGKFADEEQHFDTNILARDKILMCNLVRYILPKATIAPSVTLEDSDNGAQEKDMSDDATSWIALLLEVLCRSGMFPQIYHSLGFNRGKIEGDAVDIDYNNGNESGVRKGIITPEQIVLLNCFSDSIETYATQNLSGTNDYRKNPLGGISGEEAIQTTIYFLAQSWLELQHSKMHFFQLSADSIKSNFEEYDGEASCVVHATKIMLDILGTSLSCYDGGGSGDGGVSNTFTCFSSVRLHLGQNTALLTKAITELGIIIERLEVENRGVKARELVVSQDDQHCIIGLVRLIGNLCYRCKPNQDLVRNTFVPVSAPANEKNSVQTKQVGTSKSTPKDVTTERNGLHVILSCTSFAYGCFTLREWGIVAIRNVLEGNNANQEVVAKLEAQQVINTPELEKFGIKLNLDKKGKVVVDKSNPNAGGNDD